MEIKTLAAATRSASGTGPARRTRVAGDIPGVLYGGGQDSVPLTLNRKAFVTLVQGKQGEHAVVQLEITDRPELSGPALVKAVQHHPVKDTIVHADLFRIRLDEKIQTVVPIELAGRSKGVIDGGILDHQLHEIEVECLALDVPEKITVDVTALEMGHSIHVSELVAPEKVTIVTDGERTVVACHAPRAAKEETAEAPAEPVEIGKEAKAADAS